MESSAYAFPVTGSGLPVPPSGSRTPRRPSRRFAVCPGCQTSRLVRRDGLVCRHVSPWGSGVRCPGSDATPIPIDVQGVEDEPGQVPILTAGPALDRWEFLLLPLKTLLLTFGAYVREVPAPYVGYRGLMEERQNGCSFNRVLLMPIGQDPLERDLLVRWLLATVNGVDVSDWPVAMGPRVL